MQLEYGIFFLKENFLGQEHLLEVHGNLVGKHGLQMHRNTKTAPTTFCGSSRQPLNCY